MMLQNNLKYPRLTQPQDAQAIILIKYLPWHSSLNIEIRVPQTWIYNKLL